MYFLRFFFLYLWIFFFFSSLYTYFMQKKNISTPREYRLVIKDLIFLLFIKRKLLKWIHINEQDLILLLQIIKIQLMNIINVVIQFRQKQNQIIE